MNDYLKLTALSLLVALTLPACLDEEEEPEVIELEWDLFACDPACENGWTCSLGFCTWPSSRKHSIYLYSADLSGETQDGRTWDPNGGLPDPYIELRFNGSWFCYSATVEDSLTPQWDRECNYAILEEGILSFTVYDEDEYREDQIMLECDFILDNATAFAADLTCETDAGQVIAEIFLEVD